MNMISWITIFTILILGLIIIYQFFFGQRFISRTPLEGRLFRSDIYIDKVKRRYFYYVASNLKNESDIVFILHGAQDTGNLIRKRLGYEFDLIAEKEKFIAVYPNGFKKSWNDCRLNAHYQAKKKNLNETKFLNEIKTIISQTHNVSIKAVFIFGYSNGGQLVNRICLETPDFIDGAAIVAANLPVPKNLDCIEKRISVPLVFLSGTHDKTNPFKGGLVNVLGIKKLGYVKSTKETLDYYVKLAKCKKPIIEFIESENEVNGLTKVEKRTWKQGDEDYIIQYIIHGGGHTIPHNKMNFPRILGSTNHDINFSEEVWKFFKQIIPI